MSNIHLTNLAPWRRSALPPTGGASGTPVAFPWAGEVAFCTAFLAVLALAWMA